MSTLICLLLIGQCGLQGCPPQPQYQYQYQRQYEGPFIRKAVQMSMQTQTQPQIQTMRNGDPNVIRIKGDAGGNKYAEGQAFPSGSGFVVWADGQNCLVAASAHILAGCTSQVITYENGTQATGVIVANSVELDLVLVKAIDSRTRKSQVTLYSGRLPNNARLQWTAYKYTYPNGRENAVLVFGGGRAVGYRNLTLRYQTPTPPQSGNSGGPILYIGEVCKDCPVVGMIRETGPQECEAIESKEILALLNYYLENQSIPEPKLEAPPLPQQVAQNDTRFELILTELKDLKKRLEGLENRPAPVNLELVAIEARLVKVEEKPNPCGSINLKLIAIEARLAEMETKEVDYDALIKRLPKVVTDITQVDGTVVRKSVTLGEPTSLRFQPIKP